ncbi:hypothetical protein NCPHL90_00764 [Corynebacterium diphtheriae]|nr:hypothetical protein NCPHL90_00764 [Corynebacterium diphtheriae]
MRHASKVAVFVPFWVVIVATIMRSAGGNQIFYVGLAATLPGCAVVDVTVIG